MKKEKLLVNIWFDGGINLYGASFTNTKGETVCDVEYAPTKTMALQWLYENAPADVIKLTVNTQDRYSSSER